MQRRFRRGGQRIDADSDAACCDCDGDKFAVDGATCAPASDCDDLNPYLRPGQGFVASSVWDTTHLPTYDWDCDGTVVKQYNYGVGACASHTKIEIGGCAKFQNAFEGDPQCGQKGHYVIACANDPNPLETACVETAGDERVQGCH